MAVKLQRLTLQQYELQTKNSVSSALYVINETGKQVGKPRGEVLLNVRGENNALVCAAIQDTFIPIDLTQYAARRNLLESTEFKQLLSRRRLSIVSSDSVDAYFQSSERARNEYKRIYGIDFEATESFDVDADEIDNAESDAEFEAAVDTAAMNVEFPEAEEVLVLLSNDEEDRAYDLLNSRGYDLQIEALSYIDRQTSSTRIKELIAEILEDLSEE